MRIEVGYGFEGALTDATSRRIIAENDRAVLPRGPVRAGINAGVDQIIAVVDKGEPLPPSRRRRSRATRRGGFRFEMLLLLLVFVVVPLLGGILRRIFGTARWDRPSARASSAPGRGSSQGRCSIA